MIAEALGISLCGFERWQERQQRSERATERGRPCVIAQDARTMIRECYLAHFGQWGPQVLAAWCRRQGQGDWSPSTLAAVIDDLREPEEKEPLPVRYEITASGVMWSEDGTGFRQRGRKQELLVVQDEHSRLKLNWDLADGPAKAQDVQRYLEQAFDKYGPPLVLKHDGDAIFHTPEITALLEKHQVLDLTSPAGHPGYNGKQERSMRDIKSYERAMRKHGDRGPLETRINVTMKDLNEDRPRPVLGSRTAREAYNEGLPRHPDRRLFREEVESRERSLLSLAESRAEVRKAHRRAVEQTLMCYGLMEIEGNVSHDFLLEVGTK
jgi:transposase InsO family protein